MGYAFHITRASNWFDSADFPISQAEWEELANSHPLLIENSYVAWVDIGPQKIYELQGESANFSWRHGRIDIEGYVSDLAEGVAGEIASILNAHVCGDDD